MRTTPVPNLILDQYLSILGGAELKVLLVIIRQTLGWADRRGIYGRKESDWISGSQLRDKTGCSHRSITSAIDSLSRSKLIEVLDDYGHVLNDPYKRQGRIRLYYRLHATVYRPVDKLVDYQSTSANISDDFRKKYTELLQKLRITKETLQK